ncbi:MAG: DNA cytosine methyltransferase [Alphaproteobacteria bacterium]|nr:DNA cytosine methyltransferase [Alphaproteobacteria bacterium]
MTSFTFIDLFCGIGGFHLAAARNGGTCLFASDIDEEARKAYAYNYSLIPAGDITKITPDFIPKHDLLCAGFPCQPFSIIGKQHGFHDMRGTLFFEIVKILSSKKPPMIVLENVKQLATHNKGETFKTILTTLEKLGYKVHWKILNALHFGLPQKRERTIIVGFLNNKTPFIWPEALPTYTPLDSLLEKKVDAKHYASKHVLTKRRKAHKSQHSPAIWHENKSGNISSYPYSCALRAGASYNYLLVNGERRLTPREMLRLQGFPDSFSLVCSDSQTRKQAGNAVPVPMIEAVIKEVLRANAKITRLKEKTDKRPVSIRRAS